MFFKKREWTPPAWWLEVNRKQNVYARRLADYLGRKTAKVPAAKMRVYVLVFLVGFAAVDLGITVASLRGHRVQGMKVPFGWPEKLVIPEPNHPGHKLDFRSVMDSLKHVPVDREGFDSLLVVRPGLTDTIRKLEEILENGQ